MPDAERQSNDEPDTISLCQSQTQQPVNFLCLEWLNFFFVNWRWLGEVSGISSDAAAFKCFTECGACGSVYLMGRSGF